MQFPYRSTEQRRPPPSPWPLQSLYSNGSNHPTPKPIQYSRSGSGSAHPLNYANEFAIIAAADPSMMRGLTHRKPSTEELERELHEERIKEEIMARRIAQRRRMMMEEQMQRQTMMMMANIVDQERFGGHVLPLRREVELREGERFAVDLMDRSPFTTCRPSETLLSSCHDGTKDVDEKRPGIRMKKTASTSKTGAVRLLQSAVGKDWSCALCQVSIMSENGLNHHLKGKKHLAMAAKLSTGSNSAEPTTKNNNASSAPKKSLTQMKYRRLGGKKVCIRVNGQMREVIQKGSYLWCMVCSVKCNSRQVMETHLLGKKHVLLESKTERKAEEAEEYVSDNLSL